MLTQCPSCQTIFRVTQEILRVADGQVRCGRCQTQFDALERLVHEEPAEEIEVESPGTEAAEDTDFAVEEPEEREEITLEGKHIEITGTYRVMDAGTGSTVRQEFTEEWVEIEDIDEAAREEAPAEEIDVSAELADEAAEDARILEAAARFERETAATEPPTSHPSESASPEPVAAFRRRLARDEFVQEGAGRGEGTRDERDEEEPLDLLPARAEPKHAAAVWGVLAVPLLLLLFAQIVHHYRGDLARHPRVGELLMRAYDALDLPLTPEWDLHAYEIRQWGVVADPASPGTLRVRASITNRAEFAQPQPLLKLILEDRWGEQVRARAFEPAEYLDPTISPDRLLAPAQQTNATIAIVDPGTDAEGFRFDVCLRGAGGTVCAADLPPTR